jgi:hypothetical protein
LAGFTVGCLGGEAKSLANGKGVKVVELHFVLYCRHGCHVTSVLYRVKEKEKGNRKRGQSQRSRAQEKRKKQMTRWQIW